MKPKIETIHRCRLCKAEHRHELTSYGTRTAKIWASEAIYGSKDGVVVDLICAHDCPDGSLGVMDLIGVEIREHDCPDCHGEGQWENDKGEIIFCDCGA